MLASVEDAGLESTLFTQATPDPRIEEVAAVDGGNSSPGRGSNDGKVARGASFYFTLPGKGVDDR